MILLFGDQSSFFLKRVQHINGPRKSRAPETPSPTMSVPVAVFTRVCVKMFFGMSVRFFTGGYGRFGQEQPLLQAPRAKRAPHAKLATASFHGALWQVVDSTVGDVVQLVRTLPCHGRGREFESRRPRHSFQALGENEKFPPWSNMVQLSHCFAPIQHHFH